MGLTVQEYEETPALVVDWDLQIHKIQSGVDEQHEQARMRALIGGAGT